MFKINISLTTCFHDCRIPRKYGKVVFIIKILQTGMNVFKSHSQAIESKKYYEILTIYKIIFINCKICKTVLSRLVSCRSTLLSTWSYSDQSLSISTLSSTSSSTSSTSSIKALSGRCLCASSSYFSVSCCCPCLCSWPDPVLHLPPGLVISTLQLSCIQTQQIWTR